VHEDFVGAQTNLRFVGAHTHAHTHARTHARTHTHTHTHMHTHTDSPCGLAVLEGRAGEQRVGHGLEREADLELLYHVRLALKVQVHLRRAGVGRAHTLRTVHSTLSSIESILRATTAQRGKEPIDETAPQLGAQAGRTTSLGAPGDARTHCSCPIPPLKAGTLCRGL